MKTTLSTGTIFIVDDELESLHMLTDLLSKHHYRIRASKTAHEAFESINSELPDLILLDIKLPDFSGYELCKQLKADKKTKSVPVMFLSALNATIDKKEGFSAGAVDFITKPYILEELLLRVQTHIEIGRLRSQMELQAEELRMNNNLLKNEINEHELSSEKLQSAFATLKESKRASVNLLEDLRSEIELRKETEETIRESEAKFRQIFDLSPVGIVLAGLDKKILRCNNAFSKSLGYLPEELVGKTFTELTLKEDRQIGIEEMLAIKRGEIKSATFQKRYLRTDGQVVWGETLLSLMRDSDGNPQYFLSIVQDITESRKAEEDLSLLASRQEAILSSVPDIIMEVDNNKVYTWANKSGFEFFGDDVVGKEADFYFEGHQETYQLVQPLFKGKENTIYVESWQRRKDEENRLLAWSCRVLKDANGKVTGALSSALDITERNLAEKKLREEKDRIRTILDQVSDPIFVKDNDHRITLANRAFYEIFSLDEKSVVGYTLAESVPENERHHFLAVDRAVLDTGISDIREEKLTVKGLKRTIITKKMRHIDEAGNKILVGSIHDITERKIIEEKVKHLNEELEEKVLQRTEQLEAVNKELEAFTYSVSHDLRAPLRAVHGYTKILLDEYESKLDEEGKRLFEIVYSSASQMGVLIDDLLHLSRIAKKDMTLSLVDMKNIATSAFDETASQKEKEKIVLKIGKLNKAHGDSPLIKQVWVNLISNAIKYSSKKDAPRISIGSRTRDNMINYFIKDNGAGFDMTYKHKLFGVFQRLHNEREFEGNGVGLAIVKRIIMKHGGKVWAEGEVDKGATFYFSLPVEDNSQTAHALPAVATLSLSKGAKAGLTAHDKR